MSKWLAYQRKRIVGGLLGTLVLIGVSVWWEWPDNHVHVIFCDVGQGDATLITWKFQQLLIDGGPDSRVSDCLATYIPWWDRQLDLMIATHADSDHIGGLAGVLQVYQVKDTWMPIQGKKSADFSDFYETVLREEKQGMRLVIPVVGDHLQWGRRVRAHVISPLVEKIQNQTRISATTETYLSDTDEADLPKEESHNNLSIGLIIEIDGVYIVLTADMEKETEAAILQRGLIDRAHIQKVAHHGANTSTTQAFLQRVTPEISVISSGKNNSYGHPHPEVISRLERNGTTVLRTDQLGSIEVIIEEGRYWLAPT